MFPESGDFCGSVCACNAIAQQKLTRKESVGLIIREPNSKPTRLSNEEAVATALCAVAIRNRPQARDYKMSILLQLLDPVSAFFQQRDEAMVPVAIAHFSLDASKKFFKKGLF